ncbi:MAG: energy transducer TonB [Proteobacteria bacterium]|nr:energy transducer TonB [Pseudomonadota bacterium]
MASAASLTRLSGKAPVYPIDAERQGIEGWVDLEFLVKADGSVHEPIIRNAQPAGVFDQAAIRAVQTWRFSPAMHDGTPVEQRTRLRLRFSLNQ